ncbi:hypothetical protein FHS83_001256 [Rhizomicrobium palustre]|uniref:Tetratricopeptide repeat-containing protein n=1 Tax=Rhizomicrobium palustre TaxID=189966 RepID=A0A846MWK8_9PROT|nr:hypothetical protein [Rhizomicrobium palustre]NIK87938.1 hypothetical protein [Rhizomicrobium palustre]
MKRMMAALSLSCLALAPLAHAADAKLSDCVSMQKQVSTALENAVSNPNAESARQEAQNGRSFCTSRLYDKGVAHYAKALELLNKS